MATVADVLADKGSAVFAVSPTASVYEAIERMVANNVGALVVLDGAALTGIVTERDYLRRVALEGRTSRETTVAEIMSPGVVTVTPGTSLDQCMRFMTGRRVRHLPVLAAGRLAGIISIGDVVKRLLGEQATQIQDLTLYIQGRA
ncbi:MAG TPA: CBS domain-containing protein [Polyangiaceae bacterium]|nr:CBS domain-containing protein [Polyangiaceae bacterium]